MAYYILDKAYTVNNEGSIGAYLAVVQGKNVGECNLPSLIKGETFLGITVHSQSQTGANVAVRKAGIARAIAADSITVGSPIMITDQGRVCAICGADGEVVDCIGFAETSAEKAGDIVEVFISMHQRTI